MKTNQKLKSTFFNVLLNLLLLFGLSLSSFSQCPTVISSNPPAICDASGFNFADLSGPTYVTDSGNGIVWYDALVGGNVFNLNELVLEGTYYVDDNSGACGVRSSITVDFEVDETGQNLDRVYCSNDNATIQTYINDVLMSNIPSGGSVEIYNDFGLTNQVNPADTIPIGGTNYFIIFIDNGGCESQVEIGTVGVFVAPIDPTPETPQLFCSNNNPVVGNLDPGTAATNYNWYASLNGSGDPVLPALPLTTPLVDGATYYVQIDDIFCLSNPVAVNVTVSDPFDPGISGNLEFCEDNISTPQLEDLFLLLGGTPDTNGTWSGPIATTNGNLGRADISQLPIGTSTFTYEVPENGGCPADTANVTIIIYETFSSGTAVAPESFCVSGLPAAFDLSTLLTGDDIGGQWTQGTLSSDPIVTSPIDLTGLTPNTYNFTYTQNLTPNPCPEESTTVQVIVLPNPNAGIGLGVSFCENDLSGNSPYDLFSALTGQDNNAGTWRDANSVILSSNISITGFTVLDSPYIFEYTIDNGTCSDTEQITITIEDAPESGTVNTPIEFCEGLASANYNLFDLLDGEDQTGTWYLGTDNTGATVTNPIDLSGLTPNTYSYTFDVDAIGSCDDALVTVQVIINPLPNTGTPSPSVFCENDVAGNTPLDLFGQLTGEDSGGTWTDDDISNALTGSDVDLTVLDVGSYNYTYSITDANGCTNSSTVTITIEDAPESGTVNAPIEFCEGSASVNYDLFDLLDGEDQIGTWYLGTSNTGTAITNPIDLSGLTPNTYNYTFDVDTIGSCDDALVTVQVIINPLPNTGTPSSAVFCENDVAGNTPLDLFGQLTGEDSGGTWTDDNTSNAFTESGVDLTVLDIGSYNFTYSITDPNGCTNSSTVTITIEDAPESGIANSPAEFCIADVTVAETYNLFDLLTDEDQTGTWNDDDSSGVLVGNTVTIDGLTVGTYNFTFNVDAIGSCDDVDVTVSIVINDIPAPTAVTPQEFCDAATVADLLATGTTVQWYDEATGGNLLGASDTLINNQIYYATQTDATTGCESSIRTAVTVNVIPLPNSGVLATSPITSCNNTTIDLALGLDGTQDNTGIWYEGTGESGPVVANPTAHDVTGITPGDYTFTYVVSANPCSEASTTITVSIEEPFNSGTANGDVELCSSDADYDLFLNITGNDSGGEWSYNSSVISNILQPASAQSGTYTYSFINSCGTSSVSFDVNITPAPNGGSNGSFDICLIDLDSSNNMLDLLTVLNGTPDNMGVFTTPDISGFTGDQLDLLTLTAGTTYTFTYTVSATSPCATDATSEITVIVNDTPLVGIVDANPEFCLVDNPTVSDLASSITVLGTMNWYDDAALTIPLDSSDVLASGDYYATQTNLGCESSIAVQIDVIVNDTPTPTLDDVTLLYCISDGPTINTLSQNIVEYIDVDDNVIWYDSATAGTSFSNGDVLNIGETYFAALIDASTGCESSVRLEVTPDLTGGCDKLELPDGFSPNGDGKNDTYDVDFLTDIYPDFEIEIFNRYGNVVYKGNAASPKFDGTSNQSRIGKGDLPVGTYFYIFHFNDGEHKPEQGRLYLNR